MGEQLPPAPDVGTRQGDDSRDTSELENLRQQKINLEITVKALEGQLEEAKKNGAKYSDAKVEKWKKSVEEYQVCQVLH